MRHSENKKWKKENILSHIHHFHLMRIKWFKTQGMAIRCEWPGSQNHNDRCLQSTEIFWRNITVAQYKVEYFSTWSPQESVMDRAALKSFRKTFKVLDAHRSGRNYAFPSLTLGLWWREKKKKRVQILYMPILCIGIPQQALKQSLLLLLPSDRQRHWSTNKGRLLSRAVRKIWMEWVPVSQQHFLFIWSTHILSFIFLLLVSIHKGPRLKTVQHQLTFSAC